MKNKHLKQLLFLTIIIIIGISGCQSNASEPTSKPPTSGNEELTSKPQTEPETNQVDRESPQNLIDDDNKVSDPELISLEFEKSSHASTYVTDAAGNNNSCAKCHSPIEWAPTMADIPESCFTCKFELSDPPPFIAESQWQSITCKVCHQTDKKGNVDPEISWLEVAALDEYTVVANASELCLKCHAPSNIREHVAIQIAGVHDELLCTDCHDAHNPATSCGDSSCHEGLQDPDKIIPGHDEDHVNVACVACHDASGMEVGPHAETGIWTTFAAWSVQLEGNSENGIRPFISHNISLESNCERCHFSENPWGLTTDIQIP
ncbi:MAG TPA: hypothetical protein VK856_07325 [Anaerolineaceae bacterium]|nr:hypothetical protein [Anaerolineaceae bacterium]